MGIYLNDGFEGGPTNFYDESQPHYKTGVPEKVIHSLRPERGSCLVFNHHIVHDGGELCTGNKYILRTATSNLTMTRPLLKHHELMPCSHRCPRSLQVDSICWMYRDLTRLM